MGKYLHSNTLRAGAIGGMMATVLVLASLIPVVGCFITLVAWVAFGATGVIAAYWGKAAAAVYTIRQGALDGVVAGSLVGLVSHVLKFIVQVMLLVVLRLPLADNLGREAGRLGLGIGVECLTAIVGIVIAIVLGGLGATLYAAMGQQQEKPTAQ